MYAQPGGKNHRHDPGGNQRDTDDPEHVAGILPGGGLRKPVGHKAHGRHQGAGQHGRRGVAPGIGGGFEAVIPLLHFDHHHFDGDDGIIHQQPQGEDQRAEGDAVEVFTGGGHHHKHHGQGERHRRRDHHPHAPAHADKAHRHHHQQSDKKFDHELIDRRADIHRLIGHFGQRHAERQALIDAVRFGVQRFPQRQTIPALAHHHPQQQRRFALIADQEGSRIFIPPLNRSDIGEFQRSAPGNNRRVADLLQAVERPVEADKDLPATGLNGPGGGQHILIVQRGKNRLRREPQGSETVMRKGEINALLLFAENIHFFHPRYMQQLLAQGFSVTHQLPRRLSPRFQGKEGKGDIGEFVIHHRAGDAGRQVIRLIPELFARLIKLLRHLGRRRLILQR